MKFGMFYVMQRPDQVSDEYIYDTEIEQMVAADALGYHSIWIAEHHFDSFGVCPSITLAAAAVAARTRRLRVGMAVVLLPLHDPVHLAEELSVLDQLSRGRLEVGIGRANGRHEYHGFNVPFEESRARVDEGVAILRGLWTQERFSYQGRFREVHDITLVPRPRQKPHPPLYMACNSADTVPIAARHGLPMLTSFLVADQALAERREVYRRVSAEAGYPEADVEARLAQTWHVRFVYVAETERQALEDARDHVMGYHRAIDARTGRFRDTTTLNWEQQVNGGPAFCGTPDQVAERIAGFRERTGITNLMCFTSVRAMEPAKVLRSMELFATRVAPQFTEAPALA